MATVANTDVVELAGTTIGVKDNVRVVSVGADLRGVAETFVGSGIEFRLTYDANAFPDGDSLAIVGSGGVDAVTVGASAITLDNAGTRIVTSGGPYAGLRIEGGYGNDTITGTGALALDVDAGVGRDTVVGGNGDDVLRGGVGNDDITGGGGRDTVYGDNNDDILRMVDALSDARVDGGIGADTAYFDESLDSPIAVETLHPTGGTPPPPSGPCSYNAAARTLTAVIPAGGEATLKRQSNGAFAFGLGAAAPELCPGTAATTDAIVVLGAAGSAERLTVDVSDGLFWGGSDGAGTDYSEISIDLGDAGADTAAVRTRIYSMTLGANGLAFDNDGDVEISFAHRYALELHGGPDGSSHGPDSAVGGRLARLGDGRPVADARADRRGGERLRHPRRRRRRHAGRQPCPRRDPRRPRQRHDRRRRERRRAPRRRGRRHDPRRARQRRPLRRRRRATRLYGGEDDDSLDARDADGAADAAIDGGNGSDTGFADPADPAAVSTSSP